MTGLPEDPDRRARLLGLTLQSLVRDHFGIESFVAATGLAKGAAGVADDQAFVLVDEQPGRGLGVALAWAGRHGASRLHVIASAATGVLARRAEQFSLPIEVWHRDDRSLLSAVPEPHLAPRSVPSEHEQFRSLIVESGALINIEHGVLAGEVRGLEVCRAVTDAHTGAHRLEVGVGAHDREAFGMIHGDTPTADSLTRIVRIVDAHRSPGADPHPLNRLATERALRDRIVREPSLVGASSLSVAPPPVPRDNLKDPVPCVAVGRLDDGREVVAVFSVGIDLDVVPFAADARAALATPETELLIVVPERDASPVTLKNAAALGHPARVLGVRLP
ncbi:MAG: hypothetical protein ACO3FR_07005 [Ilumatobacteraceae bacterium]